MPTENLEMNGDADRNGEAEVRKGNTVSRYKGLASSSVMLHDYYPDQAQSRLIPHRNISQVGL